MPLFKDKNDDLKKLPTFYQVYRTNITIIFSFILAISSIDIFRSNEDYDFLFANRVLGDAWLNKCRRIRASSGCPGRLAKSSIMRIRCRVELFSRIIPPPSAPLFLLFFYHGNAKTAFVIRFDDVIDPQPSFSFLPPILFASLEKVVAVKL